MKRVTVELQPVGRGIRASVAVQTTLWKRGRAPTIAISARKEPVAVIAWHHGEPMGFDLDGQRLTGERVRQLLSLKGT